MSTSRRSCPIRLEGASYPQLSGYIPLTSNLPATECCGRNVEPWPEDQTEPAADAPFPDRVECILRQIWTAVQLLNGVQFTLSFLLATRSKLSDKQFLEQEDVTQEVSKFRDYLARIRDAV